MLAETVRLTQLINNMLDFSKIEARKLRLEIQPFDLHQSLGDTLKTLTLKLEPHEREGYDLSSHQRALHAAAPCPVPASCRLANGPFTVSIRLKATKPSKVLVFCNPPFKRGGFTNFGNVNPGDWRELSGRFDVEKLTGLRFDPLTSVGRTEIDWIRVTDKDGKLVKEWSF